MQILVLEALGLHLGYLGCYGNDWVATPNLDRLAVEGAVFDLHLADQPELEALTPWHQRSVGTGFHARPGQAPLEVPLPMRPQVARCASLTKFADGVLRELSTRDKWLWIEGPSLLPPWKLKEEAFERYFGDDEPGPWRDPPCEVVELDDDQLMQLKDTYAAVVTCWDAQLGEILDFLEDKEDVLLCVTARSGLSLGEHGMIGAPLPRMHDELVHVPLVMRFPHGQFAGVRIGALTQPVDLTPTFLEALGQPFAARHGRSLWPLLLGETSAVRPFAVSMLRAGGEESWLIRTLDRALHVRGIGDSESRQLFVKPDDRWEVNDVCHHEMESADEMEKQLREFTGELSNS